MTIKERPPVAICSDSHFFEKDKTLVCIPFYPDNDQTLSKLAYNFLGDKK